MQQNDSSYFVDILSSLEGETPLLKSFVNLSGGCIHRVYRLKTSMGDFCIKMNDANKLAMFTSESKDLDLLRNSETIRVPEVFGKGAIRDVSYLLMEYISACPRKKDYWESFGRGLASLHRSSHSSYGLSYDNYIGSLPQKNPSYTKWVDFFIKNRLEEQVRLGVSSGRLDSSFIKKINLLYTKLNSILIEEVPALIHGDLWNGNVLIDEGGAAALIDPGAYYACREIEIAFTTLFGGFLEEFYRAYNEAFPLEKGFEDRRDIYLLYPLLVHCNLFGGGYKRQAEAIIDKYI